METEKISNARIEGVVNISDDESTIRVQLQSVKVKKGNPISLDDQPIVAIGTYVNKTEFDIQSSKDVQPFNLHSGALRNINTTERYIFGDLSTSNGQSEISGYNFYIEPQTEAQYKKLVKANGKTAIIEGDIAKFTFEDGEEVGILISKISV